MPLRPVKCSRCDQRIVWVETPAGKKAPLDHPPMFVSKPMAENTVLVTSNGSNVMAIKGSSVAGYLNHFVTCPAADEFRKGGQDARETQDDHAD